MPIAKGEPWGRTGPVPAGTRTVADDAAARAVVTEARRAGEPVPPLFLLGGDLCRTLGGRGDPARLDGEVTILSVDLGAVLADGVLHWFVAHAVARRRWWRGEVVAAMNAQYLGDWDVAPRGHPGDGRLEVLRGSLPLGQRLEARRRLPTGRHLPHPAISLERTAATQVDLERPAPLYLDGTPLGPVRRLSLRVEPDALTCVV